MDYKTCNYLYDDGHTCKSPAVTRRDYCVFHLRDRAGQLRAAQYRARSLRFDLQLPPLENMHAVQSAISRVIQAIAADMIDPKRAHEILIGLRHAASNFKSPAAWQPSVYADDPSEASAIEYNNLEAEFGLPDGLDINTPPEVAFPPPSVTLSVQAATNEARVPFVSADGTVFVAGIDRPPLIPEVPPLTVRDYTAEAEAAMSESHSRGCRVERDSEDARHPGHGESRPRASAKFPPPPDAQALPRQLRALCRRSQGPEHQARRRTTPSPKTGRRKAAAEGRPVQGRPPRRTALGGDFPGPIADAPIPAPPAVAAPEDFPDTGKKPATNTPKSGQKAAKKTA